MKKIKKGNKKKAYAQKKKKMIVYRFAIIPGYNENSESDRNKKYFCKRVEKQIRVKGR